jgi:pimeloyl-ACP methyl ester carboxylesterase
MHRRTVVKAMAMGAAVIAASSQTTAAQSNIGETQTHSGPFIDTNDGTRLFYRDWGGGKPIVFCHPWALNADIWEYQLTELSAQGLRCIAYDRRGHGRSEDPGHGYDYDTLAADLAALVERLDLRDVTLVGYSMGSGEVLRRAARDRRDRVSRVVLVSPVPPVTAGGALFDTFVEGLKKDRPAFMGAAFRCFWASRWSRRR